MRHMFDVRVILVTLVGDILTQLHPVQLNPVYGSECMCECLFTFSPGFACLVGLCVGVGYGVDGGGAGVAFIVEWTQRTFGHWTLTVECCDTFWSTLTHTHTYSDTKGTTRNLVAFYRDCVQVCVPRRAVMPLVCSCCSNSWPFGLVYVGK